MLVERNAEKTHVTFQASRRSGNPGNRDRIAGPGTGGGLGARLLRPVLSQLELPEQRLWQPLRRLQWLLSARNGPNKDGRVHRWRVERLRPVSLLRSGVR